MQENKSKSYAPIIMFVYNRADHFEQTYRALAACPEAKDSELFIFSDGAKNEAGTAKVQEVRDLAHEFAKRNDFAKANIIESPVNKGLAASIISGVTDVMNQYGRAIIVEDDSVASPYYLTFMNRCLDFYKEDKSVGAVAGYTPMLPELDNYPHDSFLAYRSCSCSWATWSDRWKDIDWDLQHFEDFCKSKELRRKLNANGSDRFIRLYRQSKGKGDSWSVRFGAHLVRNDMMTVYSRTSYIKNIGCDATGTHSSIEDADTMQSNLSRAIPDFQPEHLEIDFQLQNAMKKHYSGGWLSDMKRLLATAAIVLKERMKG